MAMVSHTTSPNATPAVNATAPRMPRPSTRATMAAMPDPGEAAATTSAPANTRREVGSIISSSSGCKASCEAPHPGRPVEVLQATLQASDRRQEAKGLGARVSGVEGRGFDFSREPQLLLQDRVHGLRVGLAPGRFHHLADEPAERGRLGPHLLHLVGVGSDDGIDGPLDGARVRDLAQAALLDDVGRIAALGPDDLEHVLGDLAGDG